MWALHGRLRTMRLRRRERAAKSCCPKPAVPNGDNGWIVLKNPEIRFFKITGRNAYWPDYRVRCLRGDVGEAVGAETTKSRGPPRLNFIRPPTALIFRGRRRKPTFPTQSVVSGHWLGPEKRTSALVKVSWSPFACLFGAGVTGLQRPPRAGRNHVRDLHLLRAFDSD
jgi:hypothetical protein